MRKDDVDDVLETIIKLNEGDRFFILATFKQHKNRDIREELNILAQKGFVRMIALTDTNQKEIEPLRIEDLLELSDKELKSKKISHILIDRMVAKGNAELDEDDKHRLSDSISTAFYELGCTDFQGFLVDANVNLAPGPAFGPTMLAGVPLAFELDAGAVDQQMQRAVRAAVGDVDLQGLLTP